MDRVTVVIACLLLAVIVIGLSDMPRQWGRALPAPRIELWWNTHTVERTVPIPAYPDAWHLPVPFWLLYVASATCVAIALVMFWRCRATGHCRFSQYRHPPESF